MRKILFYLLVIFFTSIFSFSATVDFKIDTIEKTDKGFLIKGTVTGSDLNSGGIPEKDTVTINAEIPTGANFSYPAFAEWYSIRDGKLGAGKRLLTDEEVKGINVKVISIFSAVLRPPNVWYNYGGLGNWEKKAPPEVTVNFSGYIPSEYAGKTVRIHAILQHVVGGPYANWPGITYANKAIEITLPSSGTVSGNSGFSSPIGLSGSLPSNDNQGNITPSTKTIPPKKENPCKKYLDEMKKYGINENSIDSLEEKIVRIKEEIKEEQKIISKLKKERDKVITGKTFSSVYKSIGEDIERTKKLGQIGTNANLVLGELDDNVKLHRLDSIIEARKRAIKEAKDKINSIRYQIRLIYKYRACKEANK
ncbi:hypothetical protein TTHT_2032 [Thermotomaculum hydrothermale]|uniref:Uncharacterized protein n=1 Tax=Thermotomaculum hydrothermale TaxID=981385 RepID=A0A7R6PNT7_9BACT|nr:hypothetical protein [Thermotomaculum hydrothermale]BBB33472.1 hypothetical protein TTHT_2032 [Thermotomaculum hydrothermale]